MKTELTIDGIVTVPEGVTEDQFTDEFIEFLDSKGYSFGGGVNTYNGEEK